MLSRIVLVFVVLFGVSTHAQSVEELFSSALKNYQEGRYNEAQTQFQQALSQQPNNSSLLYNLGLAEYKLGHPGPAIADWRKALSIDPSSNDSRDALEFASSKLEHKELPHQASVIESTRASIPAWIGTQQSLILFAIAFFGFTWMLLGYLGRRRVANQAEEPPPSPGFRLILMGVFFIFTIGLGSLKLYDFLTPRGTVLPKTIEVRAGPDSEQPALFEIYEGLEVIIEGAQSDWLKILYPGGRGGWIPKDSVQQTSGRPL